MKRPRRLPVTRCLLRSMFRDWPALGAAILRTAELAAQDDLGPTVVLNAIIDRHGDHMRGVSAAALLEIAEALERDLPLDDLGALVLHSFEAGEAARLH